MREKKMSVKWCKALFLSLAAGCCVPVPAADAFGTGTPVAWGVLGRSNKYLKEERAAGIQMKVLEFFWKVKIQS